MPGPDPGIHVFFAQSWKTNVDGRVKPGHDESGGVLAPLSRCRPACLRDFWPQKRDGELGGGRATRQPGQVRKEAALTRSGSGRSSVSYPFFERIAQDGLSVLRWILFPLFRKPASRDNQVRIDR